MNKYLGRIITGNWKKYRAFGEGSCVFPFSIRGKYQNYVSIGKNVTIMPFSRIQCFPTNGRPDIIIGDRSFIGYYFSALSTGNAKIVIGKDVLIASHVLVTSENHGIDPENDLPYMDQPLTGATVKIGDGAWIGEKVIILPGVRIGKKSIVGAGSVVTKSIPAYSMVVGNPAKVIKKYCFETKKWEAV